MDLIKEKLVSCVNFIILIYCLNEISAKVYMRLYSEKPSYFKIYIEYYGIVINTCLLLLNIFYYWAYNTSNKFIHSFKANGLKWPWEENPAHWKKNLPSLIKVYVKEIIDSCLTILSWEEVLYFQGF